MQQGTDRWSAPLRAAVLVVGIAVAGCGSGGNALMDTSSAASSAASISGRLTASDGVSLAGTTVVAEELVGGRTATVRAIAAAPDETERSALVASVQAGGRAPLGRGRPDRKNCPATVLRNLDRRDGGVGAGGDRSFGQWKRDVHLCPPLLVEYMRHVPTVRLTRPCSHWRRPQTRP